MLQRSSGRQAVNAACQSGTQVGAKLRVRGALLSHSTSGKRDDFSRGRSFTQQEQRCGMLAHLPQTAAVGSNSTRGEGAPTSEQPPRRKMKAWLKADPSDWQRSTVTADGEVVSVGECRRPRYKKIAPAKQVMVEADDLPDHDPAKNYRTLTVHRGQYAPLYQPVPSDTPVLQFQCYRESAAVSFVNDTITTRLRVDGEGLDWDELQCESFGCVSSLGSAVGVPKELILHASKPDNIRPLWFQPRRYTPLTSAASFSASSLASRGSYNRLLLRCVDGLDDEVREAMDLLKRDGFINYVPLNAFGGGETQALELAASAATGDLLSAMGSWLQTEAEVNPYVHDYFVEYLSAELSALPGLVRSWAAEMKQRKVNKSVVSFLQKMSEVGDLSSREACEELFKAVPTHTQMDTACRGFLWNAAASQRALGLPMDRVVAGDLVAVAVDATTGSGGSGSSGKRSVGGGEETPIDPLRGWDPRSAGYTIRRIETESEARQYTIRDVVLPVPDGSSEDPTGGSNQLYPSHKVGRELYDKVAGMFDISHVMSTPALSPHTGSVTDVSTGAAYRRLVAVPEQFEYSIVEDPLSQAALKSDLVIKQERKPNIIGFTDGGAIRIREPNRFTQSLATREKLAPVLQASKHNLNTLNAAAGAAYVDTDPSKKRYGVSVALSFFLPRGSHPYSLLRETFDLHHIHHRDMIIPSDMPL